MPEDVIIEQPPLGVKPRFIHDEQRLMELHGAIARYLKHGLPILIEWVEEYNELVTKVQIKLKP